VPGDILHPERDEPLEGDMEPCLLEKFTLGAVPRGFTHLELATRALPETVTLPPAKIDQGAPQKEGRSHSKVLRDAHGGEIRNPTTRRCRRLPKGDNR
jgi:hypothetical protein